MSTYETRSRWLQLTNSETRSSSEYILAVEPNLFAPEARKGRLFIVTEANGAGARSEAACQLVLRTLRKTFYDDSSYSVTAALRKAMVAANKVLYEQNFGQGAEKRVLVGVTCALWRDRDLYVAQAGATQAYLKADDRLRALPANSAWGGATGTLRPRPLGTSLTVEPDFYRETCGPNSVLLLCSSNLLPLLGRFEVQELLRSPEPDAVVERLQSFLQLADVADAQALVLSVLPKAVADSVPPQGKDDGRTSLLGTAGERFSQLKNEAVQRLRGQDGREQQQKANVRRDYREREQAQLSTLPEEIYDDLTKRIPMPKPIDLGESLEEKIEEVRPGALRRPEDEAFPPSAFLGENLDEVELTENRIDLSDTPGMAAFGNSTKRNRNAIPEMEPTLGERLIAPFTRLRDAVESAERRRRIRRISPPEMAAMRRTPGLSYRKQRMPFPWLQLLLLIALVALLIVYGRSLADNNARQQSDEALQQAEQAVSAVRNAPDEETARTLLEPAATALEQVRASGIISDNVEFRQRLELSERDYEQALVSLRKLNYFSDLTAIGIHPQQEAGSTFSSIVIPPAPQGITNTAGFELIYALDDNSGVLYQMPKNGGELTPLLSPSDTSEISLPVGNVKGIAWREDSVVAVAQSPDGPYAYFFRSENSWRSSLLGGSDEWSSTVSKNFRIVTYEGNLYFWGAAPGQILKYFSGRVADLYDPWIKNDGEQKIDSAVDLAIDGNVYLLQPDGTILVYELNEYKRTITPPTVDPPLVAPTSFVVTGTPEEGGFIFLLDPLNERIIQIDKETGEFIQQIRANPRGSVRLDALTTLAVSDADSTRPTLYMVSEGTIYRASLPDKPRPFRDAGTPAPETTPTTNPEAQTPTAMP